MAYRNQNGFKPASEETSNGGNKPDLKGTMDVAAWWNSDAAQNTYLSIKLSDRIKLWVNPEKQRDQAE